MDDPLENNIYSCPQYEVCNSKPRKWLKQIRVDMVIQIPYKQVENKGSNLPYCSMQCHQEGRQCLMSAYPPVAAK